MVNKIVYFDIETTANHDLPAPEFSAPSNYKDPSKIAAAIEKKQAEFWAKAGMDLDYALITAIGIAVGNGKPEGRTGTEIELLEWFWQEAKGAKLIGYNIIGFDIPIITRRSLVLGVKPSRMLSGLKPWDESIVDLMMVFYHNGRGPGVKYRGLKWVCGVYGVETEWDVEEVDGSMVDGLSEAELREYVRSDVARTRELAAKTLGYYW